MNLKVAAGMIALATLSIVSVVANIVLYSMWTNQVDILKADKTSLEQEITSLQTQITTLEQGNTDLQTQVLNLEMRVETLEQENTALRAADLGLIDTWWEDIHPLLGAPYVHTYGTVVNFGDETAYNVVVTVKIYEEAVLLKTQNITLQNILGEWYGKFDVNISYSGDADSVDFSVSFT